MIKEKIDEKKKYDGWLISNNLFKRSFAVMGHNAFANMIIVGSILFLASLIGKI